MEMALQMPNNYVEVTEDEMTYVDAGGRVKLTLSEAMQRDIVTAGGSAAGALLGAAIGSAGSAVGSIVGAAAGWIIAGSISRGTINGSRTWYIDVPLVPNASFYLP